MGKILSKKKSVATIRIISPQNDTDPISKLLTHPLFLHSQDPILSIMIEPLKGFIQNKDYIPDILAVKQLFMDQLNQIVLNHGSEEQLNKLFKKVNQSNKTICWKVIPLTEVYFRCLDCEAVDDSSLIPGQCQDCFDKTNHEGHRVLKCRPANEGYTCDCGKSDMIRPEGCCPTHQPQKQTIDLALVDFPKEVRQKFTKVFKKVIFGIISMLEIQEKTDVQRIKTAIGQMVTGYTENFLSHYTYLHENLSKSFNLVTERILRSSFEAPYNRVWHDCNDYEDEDLAKNSGLKAPKQCKCTILGCLLRFSKHFDKQSQTQLEQTLTECFKERESTEFLHKEVCNHAYFLYGDPNNTNEIKKATSNLGDLLRIELIIKEGDVQCIFPLVKALKRLLLSYNELPEEKLESIMRITGPLAIFFSNGSKVSENALTKTKVLSEFLSILSDFQTSSSYPDEIEFGLFEHDIDYGALSRGLAAEKLLYFCLDHGMKTLGDKPIEIRNRHFKDIAKDWYLFFEKARAIQDQNRQEEKEANPYSGLEKTLCLMLIHYLQYNISKSSIESFFKSLFPDVNPSILASNSIKGPLITLGLMRFVEILKTSDPGLHTYYYDFGICEVDIVLSQLLTLFIDPQDLFSIFTRSFLSYSQELVDYCMAFSIPQPEDDDDSPDFRQMIAVLEDFLEFFIYLMNDEICLMNMNLRERLSRKRQDFPPERILKKLLVNTLPEGIWVTISGVKAIYEKLVCTEVFTPIDSIIAKIVLQDPEQYKIKLKKEYESELDPYIFYKLYHFSKTRQNELTSEESKTQERDIVSGKFYTDLPSYLTDIQQNIFQSQLPDFVRNIIINFTKDISRLLQPTLKLVLFNLQVVKEALENPNANTENLQKKAQENFLTKDFSQSLSKILATGQHKECDKCINNIQGLIKQLSSRMLLRQQSTKQNLDEENKEDPIAEKKRQAKEKMEKMKGEFAKKQAAFAQKNEKLLHKEDAESPDRVIENSPENKDLICQCCLDKIDESSTEGYGVLLYIEFTNNFHNIEEEIVFQEEEEGTGIFQAKWWPVISSCNHSYHLKCFDKYFKSSRGPQNQARLFFRDDAEIQCAFCKKLHNNFLAMKTETTPNKNAAVGYMASLVYQLASRRGSSTALDGPLQLDTSFKEIMKRGYEYFVESFHLFKTSHALRENFELHVNFFNTLKACTTIEFETETENSSFITSIFASKATNEKVYPELVLDKLLFTLMFEKSVLPGDDKSFSVQEHLQIIKQYVLFNFVQHAVSGNKTVQLADIPTLYNKNKDLRNKITNELIFSMQKALLAYYLNKCVLGSSESSERSEFCRILCSPDNTHEKLDLLLKHTQISLSFDQLIEESLLLINVLTESDKNLLGSIFTSPAPISALSRVKFAPHFQSTALPHDFLQFNEKYLKRKCELCNKYNPTLFQSICLICGRIFCGTTCDPNPNEPTMPGNLSKHASKCHMGLALFFLIDLHWVVLVKWPFNLVICNAPTYVSELGEWITEMFSKANFDGPGIPKSLDFKKFTLYDKVPKRMKKLIMHHTIGQEIFENASQEALIRDLRW